MVIIIPQAVGLAIRGSGWVVGGSGAPQNF
jgi:hypothetical protein